jgi:hypothetical protein
MTECEAVFCFWSLVFDGANFRKIFLTHGVRSILLWVWEGGAPSLEGAE